MRRKSKGLLVERTDLLSVSFMQRAWCEELLHQAGAATTAQEKPEVGRMRAAPLGPSSLCGKQFLHQLVLVPKCGNAQK